MTLEAADFARVCEQASAEGRGLPTRTIQVKTVEECYE